MHEKTILKVWICFSKRWLTFKTQFKTEFLLPTLIAKKCLELCFIYIIYIYISNLCSYKIRFDHHTETYKKKTNVETLYKIWFVPFVSWLPSSMSNHDGKWVLIYIYIFKDIFVLPCFNGFFNFLSLIHVHFSFWFLLNFLQAQI